MKDIIVLCFLLDTMIPHLLFAFEVNVLFVSFKHSYCLCLKLMCSLQVSSIVRVYNAPHADHGTTTMQDPGNLGTLIRSACAFNWVCHFRFLNYLLKFLKHRMLTIRVCYKSI
jgi:hypothetical protein